MIREKLNEGYKKIYSLVENSMTNEVYPTIKSQFNKFEYEVDDELSYIMREHRMQNSPAIRRNIESIIEESKYQLNREIAKSRDQILEACKELYRGIIDVVNSQLSPRQKKSAITNLFGEYDSKVKSIYSKTQNMEFELFSELDRYARRNFGDNENLYYDIKDYFRRTERRVVDIYSESITEVLRKSTNMIAQDLQEHIIPYLKEEKTKEQKDQQLEQMKNDKNYNFYLKTQVFAASIGLINENDMPDMTDLDVQLYENYSKQIENIQSITNQIVSGLDQELKKGTSDLNSKLSRVLTKVGAYLTACSKKDFSEGIFNEYIEEFSSNNNLSPQYQKYLKELAQGMSEKYNAYVNERLNNIFQETMEIIKQQIKVAKYDQAVANITAGTINPGDEAPNQGPKF